MADRDVGIEEALSSAPVAAAAADVTGERKRGR